MYKAPPFMVLPVKLLLNNPVNFGAEYPRFGGDVLVKVLPAMFRFDEPPPAVITPMLGIEFCVTLTSVQSFIRSDDCCEELTRQLAIVPGPAPKQSMLSAGQALTVTDFKLKCVAPFMKTPALIVPVGVLL